MLSDLRAGQSVNAASVSYEPTARDEPLEIIPWNLALLQIIRSHKTNLLRKGKEPGRMSRFVRDSNVSFHARL